MDAPDVSAQSGAATPSTKGKRKSARRAGKPSANGKYNAKGERVELHGKQVWIPSAGQAIRLRQLIRLEERGVIGNLRAEIRFPVAIGNVIVFHYRCDHIYDELDANGRPLRTVYEEVKGFITPEYRLKKKVFEAVQQVKISELMFDGRSPKKLAEWQEMWENKIPD